MSNIESQTLSKVPFPVGAYLKKLRKEGRLPEQEVSVIRANAVANLELLNDYCRRQVEQPFDPWVGWLVEAFDMEYASAIEHLGNKHKAVSEFFRANTDFETVFGGLDEKSQYVAKPWSKLEDARRKSKVKASCPLFNLLNDCARRAFNKYKLKRMPESANNEDGSSSSLLPTVPPLENVELGKFSRTSSQMTKKSGQPPRNVSQPKEKSPKLPSKRGNSSDDEDAAGSGSHMKPKRKPAKRQ